MSVFATQVGCANPSADTDTDSGGGTSETDSETTDAETSETGEVTTEGETDTDAGTDTDGEMDFPPVTEPGPYHVGYRNFEVVYTPIGETEARTLEVATWYPTDESSGSASVYAGLVTREDVWLGAAPTADNDLPVLLFSHGNGGLAEQSYPLTEFFASHGWVVISPNHTGNTIVDIDEALLPKMVVWRPQDMIASYEAIIGEGAQDPLTGKLGEELAVMGHSFGGYTSLVLAGGSFDLAGLDAECEADPESLACTGIDPELATQLADPRVDVAIPLTPGPAFVFGVDDAGGVADVDVPVMLMTSVLDETTPDNTDGDPIWSSLDGSEDRRVEFLTGGHFTFSIACDFDFISGDGCGDTFIPAEEAFPIAAAYSLAFARTHLWGDGSVADLLAGEVVLSDE
ncbi:MAG: alpha/beta hydrolase family protein, partial [Nannocystaceae bacterium]